MNVHASRQLKKGHLEILQWARQNGCLWDRRVCYYAAKNGHFNVLIWAKENGCPFTGLEKVSEPLLVSQMMIFTQ